MQDVNIQPHKIFFFRGNNVLYYEYCTSIDKNKIFSIPLLIIDCEFNMNMTRHERWFINTGTMNSNNCSQNYKEFTKMVYGTRKCKL